MYLTLKYSNIYCNILHSSSIILFFFLRNPRNKLLRLLQVFFSSRQISFVIKQKPIYFTCHFFSDTSITHCYTLQSYTLGVIFFMFLIHESTRVFYL